MTDGGKAWVTLATNDSYALGACVLANSLKRVNTVGKLAVMVTPGISSAMRAVLEASFNEVTEVNVLDSEDAANLALLTRPELGITFTKLHCWRLTQYEKCVFLDADTLVLQNCDELFDREEFSAAPDSGWPDCFNSGVFVFKPCLDTYAKLLQFAIEKGSFDGGDQGLLNLYFSDWSTSDIGRHLPFVYNMVASATYSYLPAYKVFGQNVKIAHFIGPSKPWVQFFDSSTGLVQPEPGQEHLQDLLQSWWDIFRNDVHPKLTPEMGESATEVEQVHSTYAQIIMAPIHYPDTQNSYPSGFGNLPIDLSQLHIAIQRFPPENVQMQIQQQNNPPPPVHPHQQENFPPPPVHYYQEHPPPPPVHHQQHHFPPPPGQAHHHYEHPAPQPAQNYENHSYNHSSHVAQSQPHDTATTSDSCSNFQNVFAQSQQENSSNGPHPSQSSLNPSVHYEVPAPGATNLGSFTSPDTSHTSSNTKGLAGAYAKMSFVGDKSSEQLQIEDTMRKSAWEQGRIDYLGKDSFDNILKKIQASMAQATVEPRAKSPSPAKTTRKSPRSSPPKDATPAPTTEPTPEAAAAPEPAAAPAAAPAEPAAAPEAKAETAPAPEAQPEATPAAEPEVTPVAAETTDAPAAAPASEAPAVQTEAPAAPEAVPEPVVAQAVTQAAAAPEPAAAPAAEQAATPAPEPAAAPVPETAAEPAAAPEPTPEPAAAPAPEPAAAPAPEPAAAPAPEPAATPAPEPAPTPAPEPAAAAPVPEPAPQPQQAAPESQPEPEPVSEPVIIPQKVAPKTEEAPQAAPAPPQKSAEDVEEERLAQERQAIEKKLAEQKLIAEQKLEEEKQRAAAAAAALASAKAAEEAAAKASAAAQSAAAAPPPSKQEPAAAAAPPQQPQQQPKAPPRGKGKGSKTKKKREQAMTQKTVNGEQKQTPNTNKTTSNIPNIGYGLTLGCALVLVIAMGALLLPYKFIPR